MGVEAGGETNALLDPVVEIGCISISGNMAEYSQTLRNNPATRPGHDAPGNNQRQFGEILGQAARLRSQRIF